MSKNIIYRWGVVLLLWGALVINTAASENNIVREIEFQGLTTVKQGRVAAMLRQYVGEEFSAFRCRQDFLRLYKSNLFSDIKLRRDDFEDGVKLTYVFQEQPLVQDIEFSGNKKLEDVKITTYLNSKLDFREKIVKGKALASYKLELYQRLIKACYEREGYYLAEITLEIKESEPGYVVVNFRIKENKLIRIRKLKFLGNRAYSDWRLRWVINTERYFFPFVIGKYEEEILKDDLKLIEEFYHKRGYLSMRVTDHQVKVDKARNRIEIEISLEEGPRYRYGEMTLIGNIGNKTTDFQPLFSEEQIKYWLNLKPGRRYNQNKIDEVTAYVKDKFGELGYISAYVNVEPVLDVKRGVADLKVTVAEGNKYYVERIDFAGNDNTKEKVMRRQLLLKPKDVADTTKLRRSYERLNRLEYFKEIEPQVQPGSRNDLVNIVWQMQEQKTGRFRVGAAYSNLDKLTGQMSLGIINLFGYGQKVDAQLEVGGDRGSLFYYSFGFTEPFLLDTHNYVSVRYENSRRETLALEDNKRVGYALRKHGGSLRVGHPYWDYLWVFLKHGISSSDYGYYQINKAADPVPLPKDLEIGRKMTRTLSLALNWDDRDDEFFTTRGNYQYVELTQAGGFLKGDNHFLKWNYDTRWYYGFYREQLALATRFAGDYVKPFAPSDKVPIDEKFYLGGTTSVRGYPDFSLGFQRRYRLYSNSEFRWRVHKIFQLVTFYDVGGSWDSQTDMSTADFYPGAGFGFRINVPMLGVIRIDYGVPLDPRWPTDKDHGTIHFNVGTTF